jgi:threonine/homoserine/homoserine lactone efflux protein
MSVFLAMAVFSFVMSISPGPVNIITLSIGANSGFRSALPFVFGATVGFTLLLLLIGIGLGESVMSAPYFIDVISVIGTVFICYVGYKIATAEGSVQIKVEDLPSFKHGFLLQWLNPKAWAACLAGVALFASPESSGPLFTFVSIYFVICFFGIGSWAVFGEKSLILINNPERMFYFNRVMGGTLIVVALFMLSQQLRAI